MKKMLKTYEALFQPITIGKVKIKNRIAMAPCATHQATPDGYVNNQIKAWFVARAKGGTQATPRAKEFGQMVLKDDGPGFWDC